MKKKTGRSEGCYWGPTFMVLVNVNKIEEYLLCTWGTVEWIQCKSTKICWNKTTHPKSNFLTAALWGHKRTVVALLQCNALTKFKFKVACSRVARALKGECVAYCKCIDEPLLGGGRLALPGLWVIVTPMCVLAPRQPMHQTSNTLHLERPSSALQPRYNSLCNKHLALYA